MTKDKANKLIMCNTLKKIQNKKAEDILKEYWPEDTIPIDIKKILDRIGIVYQKTTFSDLYEIDYIKEKVEKFGEIFGVVVAKDDNVGIFYKKNKDAHNTPKKNILAEYKANFTLAHELGHCVIHAVDVEKEGYIDFALKYSRQETHFENKKEEIAYFYREKEANIFAGEILMPEHKIHQVIDRIKTPYLTVIADTFRVTTNVMKARLDFLNIPFIDDREDGKDVSNRIDYLINN